MGILFGFSSVSPAPPGESLTWTEAFKGDGSGSVVENSATSLTITAAGTQDHANIAYAYQTVTSGDIQVKALLPLQTEWSGHIENWTGFGVGLTEGTADGDYWAQTWWPANIGTARGKYGTQASQTSSVGIVGTALPRWVAITYDDTAKEIKFWESADDTDWFQIGATVSKTLTYNVLAYVWGTSQDVTQTTTATLTSCAVGSSITITEAAAPTPDNRVGIIQEITALTTTFNAHGDPVDGVHLKTFVTSTDAHISHTGGGTWSSTWDGTRVDLFSEEGVHGPVTDDAIRMQLRYDCDYTTYENAPRNKLIWIPGGYGSTDMLAHNTEYWMSLGIFLPADYESDGVFARETLVQLHSDSTAPGMLELSVAQGKWDSVSRFNATNAVGGVDVDHINNASVTADRGKITYFTYNFIFNPFATSTLIDSSMGAKAQVGETYPGNTGMMRVWKTLDPGATCTSDDMGVVTNSTGSRADFLVSNVVNGPIGRVPDWFGGISGRPSIQPELGLYKSGWFNGEPFATRPTIPHAKSTKAGPIVMYFTAARIGDSSSNYASVHPVPDSVEPT